MNTTGSIDGWLYKGQTKDQLWGKYVKDDGKSNLDRETYRKQREQERQREKTRQFNSLSESDRDRESKKLLKQLGLNSKHKAALLNRGLKASEIELIGFRTVERGQRLLAPVSSDLAGVNSNGLSLRVPDGFLVPIFNELEQIIGFQLARDDRNPKYQWLKSGNSSHLPTGELPITSCKGQDSDVRLTEGILKPLVASKRRNQNFIGASGGQFASSPIQLKTRLETLKPKRVILTPDSGSLINNHVLRQNRETYKLVKSFGYDVYVEDWGQGNNKNALDIDEISPDTQTKIIPYEQWDKDYLPELKDDWQKSARQHWKRHKQFTPSVTQNQHYSDFRFPSNGETLVIKAGLGTGKTYQIADNINQLPDNQGIIALFATNALAYNFCERTGIKHLHRDNAFDELSKPNGRVALCTNSLTHFLNPDWFNDKILIIDELMTVINHLVTSNTHKKNRKECMSLNTECLRRASIRVLSDGHVADWIIENYIKQLIGEHPVIKLENLYKPTRPRVEFLIGCEGVKGVKPNDSSALIPAILSSPKLGLICDSQIACEAWEELLKSAGKRGIRIDSKTTADKKHPAQKFLSNPDKWIQEFNPDYVILSPTAQCGIDISVKNYFSDVFSFFCGVLTTDAQLQFIARFRDSGIKHHIFCVEYTKKNQELFSSPFASTIKKTVNEFLLQDIESITKDSNNLYSHLQQIIDDAKDDVNHDAWAIFKSQDNYERANLRECLLESLLEAGYQVKETVLEADKGSKTWLNTAKEKVKLNNCNDIYHAENITWSEAQEIAANWNATWEERCSVLKASLLERLPGIDRDPLWSPQFIYELIYGNRQLIRGCELFYLLSNPEDTERHQQNLWAAVALGSDKFLPDIRSRHQIITALLELGITQFLDPALDWCNSSPELLELVKRGKGKKIRIALGFSPGVDPIKYLRRCLQLIGVDLSYRRQERLNGSPNPIRFYGMNQDKVYNPIRIAVLDAVKLRYSDEAARAEIKPSKWVEFSEKFEASEQPKTTAIYNVEPVADQLNLLSELAVSATPEKPKTESKCPVAIGQKFRWKHPTLGTWEYFTVKGYEQHNGNYSVWLGSCIWESLEDLLSRYESITG